MTIQTNIRMTAAPLLSPSSLSSHLCKPSGDRTYFEVITDSKLLVRSYSMDWDIYAGR